MKTTLNKIRAYNPCPDGWKKLLDHLGKTQADDEPLAITTILNSNGLDDAIWCLRAVDGHDDAIRLFAVRCARKVQHLMNDPRSIDALDVAERFANGQATSEELTAAAGSAIAAAELAAELAAEAAAEAAAGFAAGVAMWAAAELVAEAAAETAVGSAAGSASAAANAAWDTAETAARAAQEADLRQMCKQGEQA